MNEYLTLYQAGLSGLGLVAFAFLYSLGGREGTTKGWRRFIATFVLTSTVNLISLWKGVWHPFLLLTYPILVIGTSMGYGGDTLKTKLFKRTKVAVCIILAGLPFCFTLGAWWLLLPHFGVGLWSVFYGVKNPIEAPSEEFFIAMLLGLGLIIYPFLS